MREAVARMPAPRGGRAGRRAPLPRGLPGGKAPPGGSTARDRVRAGAENRTRKVRQRERMGTTAAGEGRVYAFPGDPRMHSLRRAALDLLERLSRLIPFDTGMVFLKEDPGVFLYLGGYPVEGEGCLTAAPSTHRRRAERATSASSAAPQDGLLLIDFARRHGLRHFDVYDLPAGEAKAIYVVLGDRGESRGWMRSPEAVRDAARNSLASIVRECGMDGEPRSARHLRALMEVSRMLAEETDVGSLTGRVLDIVERFTGAKMAYVMLLDPRRPSRLRGLAVKLEGELVELDTGMRNALYRKAAEMGLENLMYAMEECVSPGLIREGTTFLEVPIRLEGELLGMIKCFLGEREPDEADLEFFRALAAQLAAGIKISDHYRRLKEREEGLSALNRVLSDLSECLFQEEMADYLARSLPSILGVEGMALLRTGGKHGAPLVFLRLRVDGEDPAQEDLTRSLLERVFAEARGHPGRRAADRWSLLSRKDLLEVAGNPEVLEEAGVQEVFLFPVVSSEEGELWCLVFSAREGGLDDDRFRSVADSLVEAVQSSFLRAAFYEEALNEEGKLTAVFNAMQDAVLVIDGEGRLLSANRVADRLFRFREKGTLGRRLEEGDLYPALYRFIFDPPEERKGGVSAEMTVPVEPPRYVRAYRSEVKLPAGEAVGEVVVVRDITEEKEVEVLKDDFLACVSHELRTPLSIILGYLEVLEDNWDRLDEATRRDSLRSTHRAAEKLRGVITDILDTARTVRRELVLNRSPVRLDALAEEMVRQAQVGDADHEYRFVRKPGSCLTLADETKIRRVLWNLLDNARKFSPPGTEVTVSAGRRSDGVFLSVRDQGVGISTWHLPVIFRRFAQVDHGDARRSQGLGIGLYLVAEVVELHGGKVEVRSEPGRGSVFTVVLPVAEEGAGEGAADRDGGACVWKDIAEETVSCSPGRSEGRI